ncbi:MAG: HD domain-containing protein [Gemmatimonadetes bacterium]|nr:HD domain-containing protein [Gemmatimonadota bacterium]
MLRRGGYTFLALQNDSSTAVDTFRQFRPDLVLLDLHMPGMDGFQVMEALQGLVPEGEYVPFVVLTGDLDPEIRARALSSGAKDFLAKPYEYNEVLLRIRNLLETRMLHQQLREHNDLLEEKVRERTKDLEETRTELLRHLAMAAEYRDDVTGRHAERVGVLSALLARRLGLSEEVVRLIRYAAPLHDVGKIGIPDSILMKSGPLSKAEFEVMKSHTHIGARILAGGRFPLLELAGEIALTHHERWDGKGYTGMAGERIPLVGRIVAVADVFDSLSHERPYKPACDLEEAMGIIEGGRGSHFDPRVVDAFVDLVEEGDLVQLRALEELEARYGKTGRVRSESTQLLAPVS